MEVSPRLLFSAASSAHSESVNSALTIRAFVKRRKQFRDLITANSNLTYSRYWRLVALSSVDFCFTIPLATWNIVANASQGTVHPYVSWHYAHWGYSRVFQFPRIVLEKYPVTVYSLETTRWAAVLCAFVFFGFFGFADEAKKNYRLLASTVTKRLGYTTFTESTAISDSYVYSSFSFRFRPCANESTILFTAWSSLVPARRPVFRFQCSSAKKLKRRGIHSIPSRISCRPRSSSTSTISSSNPTPLRTSRIRPAPRV